MKRLLPLCCVILCAACSKTDENKSTAPATSTKVSEATVTPSAAPKIDKSQMVLRELENVLASQDEKTKARYQYRNPAKTLQFFQLKPGMTVLEVLPGGGWYSNILIPFIGSEGKLIAVDYPTSIWPKFSWASTEFIEERKAWPSTWPTEMAAKHENGASVSAYTFDNMPEELSDSVDMALFIRALHNMARFEKDGKYLTDAIQETYRVVKPGGFVGVIQHEAPEDKSNEWADGSKGYLKKSWLKEVFIEQGFEFVSESDINANPKDQPGEEDSVWRLPPSLGTSKEDEELKAKMLEIGESNRMTLLFRKPQ